MRLLLSLFFVFIFKFSHFVSIIAFAQPTLLQRDPTSTSLSIPDFDIDSDSIPHSMFASLLEKRRYDDYQISDGHGGDALQQATLTLQLPFGIGTTSFARVPYEVYDHLSGMWEAIDYAHTVVFPHAIKRARQSSNTQLADALEVGRKKNEVLLRMRDKDREHGFSDEEEDEEEGGQYKVHVHE
ncbi:hypothetical protein FRC17_005360 [Serendipita sp. 399]|nr:hypothetical protein FRC17_005360 [Serendipita sp. 399]